MRLFPTARLAACTLLAMSAAAADGGVQFVGGIGKTTKSEVEDATGDSQALWFQASLQTGIQGTQQGTWIDLGLRVHSAEGDVRLFSACWSDRAPVAGGLALVLGGGLCAGTVDIGSTHTDNWSPMIQAGLNLSAGGGLVAEALYQYVPRDIGEMPMSAWVAGVGFRF